jgi:hypothetical protein
MHVAVPCVLPRSRDQRLCFVFRTAQELREAPHHKAARVFFEVDQLKCTDLRAKPPLLAPREGIPLFLQRSVSVRCGAVATEYHATRIPIVVERSIARLACGCSNARGKPRHVGCTQLSAVRQISPRSPMPTLSSRTLNPFGH